MEIVVIGVSEVVSEKNFPLVGNDAVRVTVIGSIVVSPQIFLSRTK